MQAGAPAVPGVHVLGVKLDGLLVAGDGLQVPT
jgi:hypothetical protein